MDILSIKHYITFPTFVGVIQVYCYGLRQFAVCRHFYLLQDIRIYQIANTFPKLRNFDIGNVLLAERALRSSPFSGWRKSPTKPTVSL